eukprot:gene397-723_t
MLPYEFSSRFLPLEDIINLKLVSKALTSTIRNISTVSVTTPCLPLNRLETILQVLPNIRELNISDASTLVLGVDFFSRKCLTNITHLKLKRFPLGFLSSNAEALSFSPLQHLEIYNLPSHGEPLLEKILQFPKFLDLSGCTNIGIDSDNLLKMNTTDSSFLINNKNKWTNSNIAPPTISSEKILTTNHSNSIHNDNDNEYLECFLFRLRVGCPLLLLKEQHLGGTSLRKIFQNETQVIEDEIKEGNALNNCYKAHSADNLQQEGNIPTEKEIRVQGRRRAGQLSKYIPLKSLVCYSLVPR